MKEQHEGPVVIEHPNRAKSSSKLIRAVVVLLLLASAALIALVTFGGWDVLQGMRAICIGWILVYLVFAYYVTRWNRGVLPVIAALSVIMLIFAVIAVPSWFDRDAAGFSQPALSAEVLGTLTAILVAVQVLLALIAMQGFTQAWNVEVEHWPEEEPDYVPLGV